MPDLTDLARPTDPPEFGNWARLLTLFFEGGSSAVQPRELDLALETSAEFRRLFVAVAQQRVVISRILRSAAAEKSYGTSPATAVLGWLGNAVAGIGRPTTWAAIAGGVLFAAYFTVISWDMRGDRARDLSLEAQAAQEAGGIRQEAGGDGNAHASAVATITDGRDAKWSAPAHKSEIRNQKSAIAPGEPLELASGTVELKLKKGVTLAIEGPARWSIDDNNRATLTLGKLVAKVPQLAIGFTLDTPAGQIVDLGTEFGVEVAADGVAEINVFEGQVKAKSDAGEAKLLTAGNAVRLNAGRSPQSISPRPEKFAGLRTERNLDGKVVLFRDNFDAVEPRTNIDPGAGDLASRQGGLLRSLTYVRHFWGEPRPFCQLANSSHGPSTSLELTAVRESGFVQVSPNANFRLMRPGGVKFTVEVDVVPAPDRPANSAPTVPEQDTWAGIIVGAQDQQVSLGGPGGIGFLVRNSGNYEATDGTGDRWDYASLGTRVSPRAGARRLRLEYLVRGFDRGKPVDVSAFIDEVCVVQFQTRAAIRENFIVLAAHSSGDLAASSFDNLSIRSEPLENVRQPNSSIESDVSGK
jgi:hypothetical protein